MRERAGSDLLRRLLSAGGALGCAVAIGWGAYAAHGVGDALRARADSAMWLLAMHGLALALFAPRQRSRLELFVLFGWAVGTIAFCGSLMLSIVVRTPTTLAPAGGVLLMLAWLAQAVAALRR